jgi:hypothetical protein
MPYPLVEVRRMNVVRRGGVGRTKTDNTEQLVVRVPKPLRDRIKALVPLMAQPGFTSTETDVTRAALLAGVAALEKRHTAPKTSRKR